MSAPAVMIDRETVEAVLLWGADKLPAHVISDIKDACEMADREHDKERHDGSDNLQREDQGRQKQL